MNHRESNLQIQCLRWFRYQFPAYARLMEHPKNEGDGNRARGAIAKAEGVQPGVADLILHIPAVFHYEENPETCFFPDIHDYHSLAIEMKTANGTQSKKQKEWQQYFEAAGGRYVIVRTFEQFTATVTEYLSNVPTRVHEHIRDLHARLQLEADMEAKGKFRKLKARQP